MKKSLIFALVLALLLALTAPAFAFAIERSAQNLTVDGRTVTCDKYNMTMAMTHIRLFHH